MVFAALFSPRGPKLRLYETDETDAEPACHFLLPVSIASRCTHTVTFGKVGDNLAIAEANKRML